MAQNLENRPIKISIDTKKAFKTKSVRQLKKEKFLFSTMNSFWLVWIFSKTAKLFLLGISPFRCYIKNTIYNHFCAGETLEESTKVVVKLKENGIKTILDYSKEGHGTTAEFQASIDEIKRVIELAANEKSIPYTSIKLTGVANFSLLEKISKSEALSTSDKDEFQKTMNRLDELFQFCLNNDVPIYIDAEESWIQNAIDQIAEHFMEKYNKRKAIVNTTIQFYRWDRLKYLRKLYERALQKNFFLGIKIVRGAYMEKENDRAHKMQYASPISAYKENVDNDFNEAVRFCLKRIEKISICVGTHNEESTLNLINLMHQNGIEKSDNRVYFSQLYGMSDHISYDLAHEGYNVTKYVPYGPIKSSLPYLIRRAMENTSIAGQSSRELQMIKEELKARREQKLLR
ncbi:MAG: proline dehydrogenase family protein [Flavobacteriales bacterium]|nr:proline dehydrogenase family protein [Flavobacteriales bacterium]